MSFFRIRQKYFKSNIVRGRPRPRMERETFSAYSRPFVTRWFIAFSVPVYQEAMFINSVFLRSCPIFILIVVVVYSEKNTSPVLLIQWLQTRRNKPQLDYIT